MGTENMVNKSGLCRPPALKNLKQYFIEKGLSAKVAEGFYYYHQARKWKNKNGSGIKNWKVVANNWIWLHQQLNKPQTIEVKLKLQIPPGYQLESHGR